MTPTLVIILTLASICLAAITQGITGFGFGLVAMSLLPLFTQAKEATVVMSVLNLATNILVLASVRHCLRWRDSLFPLIGMAIGVPLGVYALTILDEQIVRKLVAIVVIFACLQVAFPRWRLKFGAKWPMGVVAGFVGGVLGGAFGIGGPPVVAYAAMQDWEAGRYKAMLCAYFTVSNIYRVVLLVSGGLLTGVIFRQALLGLPALFLGVYIGVKAYNKLSGDGFRKAVLITLVLLALTLLVS